MISDRAAEVFLQAQTLSDKERREFLNSVCGEDVALRGEVEGLLTAANDAEAYFQGISGRISLPALADDEPSELKRDTLIGNWRLLQRVGHGGMGAVYLAERADGQFQHRAALKILPIGLDSEHARARLIIERQILARLVHDNIARLLDGGVTDDDLPYFVMDYVEGEHIDAYCDAHNLSIRQRVALVLEVAAAVQFAHRNLVIHRDLKPANVIVNERGQVRLLDFGIAKMLSSDAASETLTREALRPATPAYASPEMLRGEPVDVTTDIYSIGALLYVLFTGRQPLEFGGLSLGEMYRRSAEDEPLALSSHNQKLAGDLEAIVEKALAKQPEERYDSVQSLASDLRNYLEGRPVSAKAPTIIYRARKFIRRHRFGVSVSAAAFIALAAITGIAMRSAIVSERQAQQIALERDRAEETKAFLISIFTSADPNVEPQQLTAREILDIGRARIEDELARQPAIQADLLHAMSGVYANWRMAEEGRSLLMRELSLREAVNGADSVEYAETLIGLAFINEIGGDYEQSIAQAEQVLSIAAGRNNVELQAIAEERIGRVWHLQGNLDVAAEHFERAMVLSVDWFGPESKEVAELNVHLANLYNHRQDYENSLQTFNTAMRIYRLNIDGDSSLISSIYLGMGSVLTSLERYDDAWAAYESGMAMNERLFGASNSYESYFVNGMGYVAEGRADLPAAQLYFTEARRLLLQHMPESPNLAFVNANLGRVHFTMGDYEAAEDTLRTSLTIFESKLPQHWARGNVQWQLGLCLLEKNRFDEAKTLIESGTLIVRDRWGVEHPKTRKAEAATEQLRLALASRQ